jgi:predicted acyltransferase
MSPCGSSGATSVMTRLMQRARRPVFCDQPFDPEGVLSTLNAIAASAIGAMFVSARRKTQAVASTLLVLAGVALSQFIPINKPLYTTSYLLVTSGVCGGLYWVAQLVPDGAPSTALQLYGRHALLMFFLGGLAIPERILQSIVVVAPSRTVGLGGGALLTAMIYAVCLRGPGNSASTAGVVAAALVVLKWAAGLVSDGALAAEPQPHRSKAWLSSLPGVLQYLHVVAPAEIDRASSCTSLLDIIKAACLHSASGNIPAAELIYAALKLMIMAVVATS